MNTDALAFWILITAVVALCLLALGLIGSVLWLSTDGAARAAEADERWRENGR
jgi:flagellar basal body-associated protein FliL